MNGVEAAEVLSLGDEAFWMGDRAAAGTAWRRALAGVDGCEEAQCHAVEAMARLRLVHREGNLAPFWHEAGWTRALAACPIAEPWCVLASADYALSVPEFAGGSPSLAAELALPLLATESVAAAAAARLQLAAARGSGVPVVPWPTTGHDGMARGMQAAGRVEPADPGTWSVGLGLTAAPYGGVGGFVRFVHPDVAAAGHRLSLMAFADTALQGGASASFTARFPGRPSIGLAVSRGTLWRWDDWTAADGIAGYAFDRGDAALSLGWAKAPLSVSGGAAMVVGLRGDRVGGGEPALPTSDWVLVEPLGPETVVAAGPSATGRFADRSGGYDFSTSGQVLLDVEDAEPHVHLTVDLRVVRPVGRGSLAGRVLGELTPDEESLFLRAAVGGTTLLRGLPYGRFRDEVLVAVQVELRHPIAGPFEGAVFVDSALCDGPHGTVGGGLRMVLPPGRDNLTRIDVGVSPEGLGWGVVVAYGEAF